MRQVFGEYGMKVSSWGSGTLKVVILVENHPQKRNFRLDENHTPIRPRSGGLITVAVGSVNYRSEQYTYS